MSAIGRIDAADRLLTLREVLETVGLSKAMVYRKIRGGTFPVQCKVGGTSSRWSQNEIEAWMAHQLATRRAA